MKQLHTLQMSGDYVTELINEFFMDRIVCGFKFAYSIKDS